jgi:hypothetical protein
MASRSVCSIVPQDAVVREVIHPLNEVVAAGDRLPQPIADDDRSPADD